MTSAGGPATHPATSPPADPSPPEKKVGQLQPHRATVQSRGVPPPRPHRRTVGSCVHGIRRTHRVQRAPPLRVGCGEGRREGSALLDDDDPHVGWHLEVAATVGGATGRVGWSAHPAPIQSGRGLFVSVERQAHEHGHHSAAALQANQVNQTTKPERACAHTCPLRSTPA